MLTTTPAWGAKALTVARHRARLAGVSARRREPLEPDRLPARVQTDVPGLPGVTITHHYGYAPERAVDALVGLVRAERGRRARTETAGEDQAA